MDSQTPSCNPELWGGIECTINRVGNRYFDQLQYSGHYKRKSDLDLFADLGIRKIRYPILWEKHQPEQTTDINWQWTTARLTSLKEKGIDVIAGLLHHGSGPAFTHLLDNRFPYHLAEYAKQVAVQFPWINHYTPVNEPLTTARFSGLYGIWYPHLCNDRDFIRMLLNELKATVLAMEAIRTVNPSAKLVQTEDLGKTYSTETLKYQADFENERRWLTYDFLCGLVTTKHPLWPWLQSVGVTEEDLLFFQQNVCIPDIFGFNHYVTSERYLDERLHLYAEHTYGDNGRHRYADVEVVRVEVEEETGIEVLLQEAWNRFQRPIAVTEVHLHCHREEQLRWFQHVWQAAKKLKQKGVAIEGVTAWALLGSFGWNRLLTKPKGLYEPGVFDLRSKYPRPTALARYIKQIGEEKEGHLLARDKGWWLRSTRFFHKPSVLRLHTASLLYSGTRPVMIIGKNGVLGRAFARICADRSIAYVLLGRQECDITQPQAIEAAINTFKPWAVINAAGYTQVDEAEKEQERCFLENATGAGNLAAACQKHELKLLTFSSSQVFDGTKQKPYTERDPVHPLNVYGRSKAMSEQLVLQTNPSALVIRTSSLFGPWHAYHFLQYVVNNLSRQQQISVASDVVVSPTYVPDLVHAALDLLVDDEKGIRHVTNKGAVTWADLSFDVARWYKLDTIFINALPAEELKWSVKRPRYSALGSEKGILLPSLDNALKRFYKEQSIQVLAQSIV